MGLRRTLVCRCSRLETFRCVHSFSLRQSTHINLIIQAHTFTYTFLQVTGSSSTHIILTLHLSNLTSVSRQQVNNPVTAQQAIDKLLQNIDDGKLGVHIELNSGYYVHPILIYARSVNGTLYPVTCNFEEHGICSVLSNGELQIS